MLHINYYHHYRHIGRTLLLK